MPPVHLRFLNPVSERSFSSWAYGSVPAAGVSALDGGPCYYLVSVAPRIIRVPVRKKQLLVSVVASQDFLYTVSYAQIFLERNVHLSLFFLFPPGDLLRYLESNLKVSPQVSRALFLLL